MTNKYIIFQDKELKGYLDDEESAKKAVDTLTRQLVKELKEKNNTTTRIFTEEIDNGVNIYIQPIGSFINGSVSLHYVIEYRTIPFFN